MKKEKGKGKKKRQIDRQIERERQEGRKIAIINIEGKRNRGNRGE